MYSNPFDWGCHWVCNKLDCGKRCYSVQEKRFVSLGRDFPLHQELSQGDRDDWQERIGNVVETQLLTPEYLGVEASFKRIRRRV